MVRALAALLPLVALASEGDESSLLAAKAKKTVKSHKTGGYTAISAACDIAIKGSDCDKSFPCPHIGGQRGAGLTQQDCEDLCDATTGCSAYDFRSTDGGCFLKRAESVENAADTDTACDSTKYCGFVKAITPPAAPAIAAPSYIEVGANQDGSHGSCSANGAEIILDIDECEAAKSQIATPHTGNRAMEFDSYHDRPLGCTINRLPRGDLITLYDGGKDAYCGYGGRMCICKVLPAPEVVDATPSTPIADTTYAAGSGEDDGTTDATIETDLAGTEFDTSDLKQAIKTGHAKLQQARRTFNKAYYRAKRDCSEYDFAYAKFKGKKCVQNSGHVIGKYPGLTIAQARRACAQDTSCGGVQHIPNTKKYSVEKISSAVDNDVAQACGNHGSWVIHIVDRDTTVPPCDCVKQKFDQNGVKILRRHRFDHCVASDRSSKCITCEKSRFLHHAGLLKQNPAAKRHDELEEISVATQTPFGLAFWSAAQSGGDIKTLRKGGFRVHPEQALRHITKMWENAKCDCLDPATQVCDDGEVVSAETGDKERLSIQGKECRNQAYKTALVQMGKILFTSKDDPDGTVYAPGSDTV